METDGTEAPRAVGSSGDPGLPHPLPRGMDRLDRELARSAYHEGAIDDHVGFVGEVDDFLDWAFAYHGGQVRHQHYITNHHVELDGDEAHAETYYMFIGTERDPAAPLTVFGGRYVDRFERREGKWGIAVRLCLVEWATTRNRSCPSMPPISWLQRDGCT